MNKKETQGKQPRPSEHANGAHPAALQSPPQAMAELPSLGPIRLRALKKAGFSSLAALKAAEISVLASVSGMTEIKARQIHDYLAPFDSLPEAEPEAAAKPAVNGKGIHPTATEVLDLQKVAAECMGLAIVLLANPPKDGWRGRVERETALFAEHAVRAVTEAHTLPPPDRQRLTDSLKRLEEIIARAAYEKEMDRKAQSKLADDIDAVIEELTASAA